LFSYKSSTNGTFEALPKKKQNKRQQRPMLKCVSMGVDAKGNIWTQKGGTVVMLAAAKRYRAIKKKAGFTSASRVVVSNTTTYALSIDG
jgi:hypothetical protein